MNQRMQRLQQRLTEDDVSMALYATSANLQYFLDDTSYAWQRTMYTGGLSQFQDTAVSGHFLNLPDCILCVPRTGEPVLLTTYRRAQDMEGLGIRKELGFFTDMPDMLASHLPGGTIALGESCNAFLKKTLKEINPALEITSAEEYGEQLRAVKDTDEIARLRHLAVFTDQAMARITESLRPGISSQEVEGLISGIARENNLLDLPFPSTARFIKTDDPRCDAIDGFPVTEALTPGTSVGFDFGYVIDGYCSDFGRSFYIGKAPVEIADGYKSLQEAQCDLLARIKPGIKMDLCFQSLYKKMSERGYEKYLRKYGDFGLMGHQIGIDVHERPWVHTDQEALFVPGMVMCIEPKFWWPGKCFMRVEDMVLITETGCESLTKFNRELFELPV
ncbi:hypothetical protein AGMMS49992_15450 [Clostridia bacterium]|nr:hypothetical protein AGMMS49992_15450 [Clostridia bacterium]